MLALLQLARTVRRHAGSDAKLTGAILHDVGRTYVTESSFRSSASPMWSRQHAKTPSVVAARAPRAARAARRYGRHPRPTVVRLHRFCTLAMSDAEAPPPRLPENAGANRAARSGRPTWRCKTSRARCMQTLGGAQRSPMSCAHSATFYGLYDLPLCADAS